LLAGCGGETLYYRDTSARLPDGRWQEPLLKALKEECNVLLALYTPGYFSREKDCEISQAKIQQYERKGLQSVWANSLSQRSRIIDDLARRIHRLAKTPPPR